MAEAARTRARRPPRDGTRPPRRAVDRVGGGVGRGGCRRTEAARRAAAAMARSERRTRSLRTSTANASGSSRTASFPPSWSRATAGLPRRRSGRGHRCSRTATCRSPTSSSTVTRVTGVIDWSEAGQGDALYDLATLTLGHEEHLERRRRRLRHRRRPRRDPRVVVVAKPAGGPLADRARLRPLLARLRVRRAQIPAVMRRTSVSSTSTYPWRRSSSRPGRFATRSLCSIVHAVS